MGALAHRADDVEWLEPGDELGFIVDCVRENGRGDFVGWEGGEGLVGDLEVVVQNNKLEWWSGHCEDFALPENVYWFSLFKILNEVL